MAALDFKEFGSDQLVEGVHASLPPEIVALQAVAVVDHVCSVSQAQLEEAVGKDAEVGGSRRVDSQTVSHILGRALHCIAVACLDLPLLLTLRLRLSQQNWRCLLRHQAASCIDC